MDCGHIGRGVWLEPDATDLVWCELCGALSRDAGDTWQKPILALKQDD